MAETIPFIPRNGHQVVEIWVEVPLEELLDWGAEDEYFVDLLRDKAIDLEDDRHERAVVVGYDMVGCSSVNVATFAVKLEIEEA